HMGFAVFMGLFYGRAKLYENNGNIKKRNLDLWAAYLAAVFLHGLYDTCVMLGNLISAVMFVVYVVAMYIVVIRLVKKESAADSPI
ncbi:MAG: PrsW family intramembrane metalloprotease, partial [Clostridia bacterium]|nr:PrsW family intramembrane metalloprotease [Clostridia bacterium]